MQAFPLSIITINYNNAKGLLKTMESVCNQSFKNFEYIIIDGGSTDESIDIIKKFSDRISYWVSEKDSGIYNAMNKGVKVSNGDYLFFLNSGDYLLNSNILEETSTLIHTQDIIYSDLFIKTQLEELKKSYPDSLNFSYFFYDSLPHSGGSFFKKNIFKNGHNLFDDSLKIVADWKFYLMSIFKFNHTYKHIQKTLSVFDNTGISAVSFELIQKEKDEVLKAEFKEIYQEIFQLLSYKRQYQSLSSSRILKNYFKLKQAFSR